MWGERWGWLTLKILVDHHWEDLGQTYDAHGKHDLEAAPVPGQSVLKSK